MSKDEKLKALNLALSQIEKDFGKEAIMRLGDTNNENVEAIPTGALPLDIAIGIGGIPRGRIIEIYGPESSGKSTLAMCIAAQAQKQGGIVAYIDAEHAMDPDYAEKLGVSQKSVSRWETGKTMPDLSLYEPLCEVLGIQVSELLYAKRMSNDEKAAQGEKTALNLIMTKSQLETFSIFTELLILVGIIISITLTKILATTTFQMVITLVCGWFVWGFGLMLRVKVRKAIQKLEKS